MIQSKADYIEYLAADKAALKRTEKKPSVRDLIWKYEILLRKCEYYMNCKRGPINRIIGKYYNYKRFLLGTFCGFSIPPNCFEKGLSIAHTGTIVVNGGAKIGTNCRLHVCVNIGTQAGFSDKAPTIGNNVYIAPGVKIFGDIKISDNTIIGANAVVNKSFFEENITIAGVPARKIKNN